MQTFSDARIVKVGALPSEYQAEECPRGSVEYTVRSHTLTEFRRNPRRWLAGYESPESKSKDFGEILDCVCLTPKQFHARYAITPATYTNKKGEQSAWRNDLRIAEVAAWHDEHKGLTIVGAELNGQAHDAKKRLMEDEQISEFISSSACQIWIAANYWDKATGLTVPVKALIDMAPEPSNPTFGRCLGDLKTTRNASPRRFARDCYEYGYHLAAAWYLDLYLAATGEDRTDFAHVVVENYPPYECRMPLLSSRFVNLGRLTYQDTLARYCQALKTGNWPGYDPEGEWPITEPEPWMEDMTRIFQPIEEETEEPQTNDIIP